MTNFRKMRSKHHFKIDPIEFVYAYVLGICCAALLMLIFPQVSVANWVTISALIYLVLAYTAFPIRHGSRTARRVWRATIPVTIVGIAALGYDLAQSLELV